MMVKIMTQFGSLMDLLLENIRFQFGKMNKTYDDSLAKPS